ncbi:MAG: MFS transporter, partial [Actinomycetota bacterium]
GGPPRRRLGRPRAGGVGRGPGGGGAAGAPPTRPSTTADDGDLGGDGGGHVNGDDGERAGGPPDPKRRASVLGTALHGDATRRYALATALIGLAVGTVLVYQVPLMVDAGLPVATAAWVAGARGAAQVTGRIPLGWILDRLEPRAAVRLAFAAITVGVAMLALAGNLAFALAYVAIAGFGIGATSPLQGIYATELFERSQLGESMGLLTMIFGLSTAVGPAVVGVLSEMTGTRWWGIGIAVVTASLAVLVLRPGPPAAPEGVAVA